MSVCGGVILHKNKKVIVAKELLNSFVDECKIEKFQKISEFLGNDFGSVTIDKSVARLSCHENLPEKMWFNMIGSVPGIGNVLSPFSLMVMIIYFILFKRKQAIVLSGMICHMVH